MGDCGDEAKGGVICVAMVTGTVFWAGWHIVVRSRPEARESERGCVDIMSDTSRK